MTTILDEAINGWVLTIYDKHEKQVFIYEHWYEANEHRERVERNYAYGVLREVNKNAGIM